MHFCENIDQHENGRAVIGHNSGESEEMNVHGAYSIECRDPDGKIKWSEDFHNLVVHTGKIDALDKYLAGSAYTATFYMGLVDGGSAPTYANGDTMSSHAGWTESTVYSNANRVTVAWGAATAAAGVGSKVSTAVVFNINASGTIAGCFLTTQNTKGGTTGVLFSAGSFGGGNRAVTNGDTVSVVYTVNN